MKIRVTFDLSQYENRRLKELSGAQTGKINFEGYRMVLQQIVKKELSGKNNVKY